MLILEEPQCSGQLEDVMQLCHGLRNQDSLGTYETCNTEGHHSPVLSHACPFCSLLVAGLRDKKAAQTQRLKSFSLHTQTFYPDRVKGHQPPVGNSATRNPTLYLGFCDKNGPKTTWGEKSLFQFIGCFLPLGFIREGAQGRNLEMGTEAKPTEQQLLTDLLPLSSSATLLIQPRFVCPGLALPR